ncbi:MAG: hypothetical protein ACOYMI_08275 [Phycisphaerales bacterium]
MKQFSTGTGIAILGVCILAATVVATHRGGSEAFAQVTGGERRIVYTNLMNVNGLVCAYRIWSDNSIDWRGIGAFRLGNTTCYAPNGQSIMWQSYIWDSAQNPPSQCPNDDPGTGWRTIDNGTSGFRPLTDVDMSGEVDGGDISQVLLDMNTTSEDFPPPPIDCTINAPR